MTTDSDPLRDLHRTDPWVAAITPERIAKALAGFSLSLVEGWNFSRLTTAIQDATGSARGGVPQRNSEAKLQLEQLAKKASNLHSEMKQIGATSEMAVFWEVLRHLEQEHGKTEATHEDYQVLVLQPIKTIENLFSRAASQIGTEKRQAPGWQRKFLQERRVAFAIDLIPNFERAFDKPAKAINWRTDFGVKEPWPDFYQRIYTELFPDADRLNLSEVLQEAARELPKLESFQRWLDGEDASLSKNK